MVASGRDSLRQEQEWVESKWYLVQYGPLMCYALYYLCKRGLFQHYRFYCVIELPVYLQLALRVLTPSLSGRSSLYSITKVFVGTFRNRGRCCAYLDKIEGATHYTPFNTWFYSSLEPPRVKCYIFLGQIFNDKYKVSSKHIIFSSCCYLIFFL